LILCFVEGQKFLSFIMTVTRLPSLNKGVTLTYVTFQCKRPHVHPFLVCSVAVYSVGFYSLW